MGEAYDTWGKPWGIEKGQGLRGLGIFGVMSWDVPPMPIREGDSNHSWYGALEANFEA